MELVWIGGFDVAGGDVWEKLEGFKISRISDFLNSLCSGGQVISLRFILG